MRREFLDIMTVELIALQHFKQTFGHLVNKLRLEKIFKMFRAITIEKSHQTTCFRCHHTLQVDKQPVSNEPVATYAKLCSPKPTFFRTLFRMIRPA